MAPEMVNLWVAGCHGVWEEVGGEVGAREVGGRQLKATVRKKHPAKEEDRHQEPTEQLIMHLDSFTGDINSHAAIKSLDTRKPFRKSTLTAGSPAIVEEDHKKTCEVSSQNNCINNEFVKQVGSNIEEVINVAEVTQAHAVTEKVKQDTSVLSEALGTLLKSQEMDNKHILENSEASRSSRSEELIIKKGGRNCVKLADLPEGFKIVVKKTEKSKWKEYIGPDQKRFRSLKKMKAFYETKEQPGQGCHGSQSSLGNTCANNPSNRIQWDLNPQPPTSRSDEKIKLVKKISVVNNLTQNSSSFNANEQKELKKAVNDPKSKKEAKSIMSVGCTSRLGHQVWVTYRLPATCPIHRVVKKVAAKMGVGQEKLLLLVGEQEVVGEQLARDFNKVHLTAKTKEMTLVDIRQFPVLPKIEPTSD